MITGLLLICILGSDCKVQVSERSFRTMEQCETTNSQVVEKINSDPLLDYRVMGTKCVEWGEP